MEEEEEIIIKIKHYLKKHPEFINNWLQEQHGHHHHPQPPPPPPPPVETKGLINSHQNNNPSNTTSLKTSPQSPSPSSTSSPNPTTRHPHLQTGDVQETNANNEPLSRKLSQPPSSPETSSYSQLLSKRNSISSDRFHYFLSSLAPNSAEPEEDSPHHHSHNNNHHHEFQQTAIQEDNLQDDPLHEPRGSPVYQAEPISQQPSCSSSSSSSNDKNDQLINLVKGISNELNIDCLCEKIRVNVTHLAKAQHCRLFLARGPHEQRYLLSKSTDNSSTLALLNDKSKDRKNDKTDSIKVPFGTGIIGYVADTKDIINTDDPTKDPRYSSEVDSPFQVIPNNLLALPVCNNEGQVIGVAQLLNKAGNGSFSALDVESIQRYLTFCGIAIQNAQLFQTSVAEYRKNQLLLNLARSIFEEQTGLERLVSKIMKEAQDLLRCERSLVYLRDVPLYDASQIEKILTMQPLGAPPTPPEEKPSERKSLTRRESKTISVCEVLQEKGYPFDFVYELNTEDSEVRKISGSQLEASPLTRIAQYVAMTTEILNIGDAVSWYRESQDGGEMVPSHLSSLPRSILCMPIYNGQRQVIGVAQLINKVNCQPFTDSDAITFEAFAIFCGLGIHNTQLYEGACKLMAKQSVALECLSYHATASPEDTERLRHDEIPSCAHFKLFSYAFSDFGLTDSDTCKATIRMFFELKLVDTFHIPYNVLCRWILSVKKNYRPVKYHNWRHAFNVAQTMFTVLKIGKMEQFLDDLDILGLMVACLCHDLDHRGTNNAFQKLSASPLAVLYSTSTMEHHHFDQCVMILSSEGNNIFQDLSADNYRKVMKRVEKSILSTDLAMYFRKREKFIELVDNGEISWQGEDKKELLCGMMMTACDVAAISKPWEIQHKIAKLVADEFFDQGDLEKERLNQQPVAMMDREKKDELPKMQLCFIDVICLPLYKMLTEIFPWLLPLYDGCKANRKNWQDLAEKVDMGLTWIDHDVIEKPVEEFSCMDNTSLEDVSFVVTTLNCGANTESQAQQGRLNKRSKFRLRNWLPGTKKVNWGSEAKEQSTKSVGLLPGQLSPPLTSSPASAPAAPIHSGPYIPNDDDGLVSTDPGAKGCVGKRNRGGGDKSESKKSCSIS